MCSDGVVDTHTMEDGIQHINPEETKDVNHKIPLLLDNKSLQVYDFAEDGKKRTDDCDNQTAPNLHLIRTL